MSFDYESKGGRRAGQFHSRRFGERKTSPHLVLAVDRLVSDQTSSGEHSGRLVERGRWPEGEHDDGEQREQLRRTMPSPMNRMTFCRRGIERISFLREEEGRPRELGRTLAVLD